MAKRIIQSDNIVSNVSNNQHLFRSFRNRNGEKDDMSPNAKQHYLYHWVSRFAYCAMINLLSIQSVNATDFFGIEIGGDRTSFILRHPDAKEVPYYESIIGHAVPDVIVYETAVDNSKYPFVREATVHICRNVVVKANTNFSVSGREEYYKIKTSFLNDAGLRPATVDSGAEEMEVQSYIYTNCEKATSATIAYDNKDKVVSINIGFDDYVQQMFSWFRENKVAY